MIKARHFGLAAIFAVPAVVAVLSLIGLVAALIGDGVWNAIGWLGLGASVAVLVWALIVRRHR
ncbi:MAG: hypothetical protein HYU62_13465 [Caulobacterales bacterium]|nr:hypothetical protein [Caulobacterales bacterium]